MTTKDGISTQLAASSGPATLSEKTTVSVNTHLIRTGLDLLPLVVFFVTNLVAGIFWATALCMAATLISIGVSWLLLKRVSAMALVTGLGVMIFGGLTIWLHNDLLIKIKPTVVNLLFASALLGGLWFNQLFVRSLLGEAIKLRDEGWRKLQGRWGLFFILLALVNEVARYNLSTEVWAASKFASFPLTFIFMVSQVGLFKEYALETEAHGGESAQTPDRSL
jgi:intracellular septation protein